MFASLEPSIFKFLYPLNTQIIIALNDITNASILDFVLKAMAGFRQSNCTSRLLIFAVSSKERIFIVMSGRDFEVPDFSACIALRESVRITDFGIFESIIHCTACRIATNSEVNADNVGSNLIYFSKFNSGTTKAAPTDRFSGSLLPSVNILVQFG